MTREMNQHVSYKILTKLNSLTFMGRIDLIARLLCRQHVSQQGAPNKLMAQCFTALSLKFMPDSGISLDSCFWPPTHYNSIFIFL